MNKKTFRVQIENVEIFSILMSYFNWNEIDRVATGGMMSQAELLITYEGLTMLDPLAYIEKEDKYTNYYFSIDFPDGCSAKSVEEFYSKAVKPAKYYVFRILILFLSLRLFLAILFLRRYN